MDVHNRYPCIINKYMGINIEYIISQLFSMNQEISEQQIHCEFEDGHNAAIFDQDYWEDQENRLQSSKNIQIDPQNQKQHQELIDKIDTELKESKQNFCKVNVLKQKYGKPKSQKNVLPPLQSKKKIQSIAQKNNKKILKQGYLEKKTDGVFFKWHLRYIVLTVEKLICFNDDRKLKAISCINLKLLPVSVRQEDKTIVLDFNGECENLILKPKDKTDLFEWKQTLESVIDYQSKSQKMLLKTFVKPIYQNKEIITEKQFQKEAQTGDILLFYTKNTGAKVQRLITNSDFDHVAMVVKMKQSSIMVFQSNQLYGVSIYDWGQYMRYFDLYEKVTLRKLNSVRKNQMHHALLNFVKKNIGRKYDIGAAKLLKFQSDFDWQKVKETDEARGYFCSELVAKAYKSVGLIEDKKSSGRYWPVDFSQKGQITLKRGVWLGPEQSIVLKKHLKSMI